jgi:hypothetical protein
VTEFGSRLVFLEGKSSVFKKLLHLVVEGCGMKTILITQIGDRYLLKKRGPFRMKTETFAKPAEKLH